MPRRPDPFAGLSPRRPGPNPEELLAAGRTVEAHCYDCGRHETVDLLALIVAGKARMNLLTATPRCSECGSRSCVLRLVA